MMKTATIEPLTLTAQLARQEGKRGWFKWGCDSMKQLIEAESRLFARAGVQILSRFVPISFQQSDIYTVTSECVDAKTEHPIVLIHGFAAGVAIWSSNIQALAAKYHVHAIDLLGFGRSSRPNFHKDHMTAESEMIEAIEDWRKEMGIEKMNLVAHSFGGYLASSYTLQYPNRVNHLVLVDPWGFSERDVTLENRIPPVWRAIIRGTVLNFNPLATLRAAGSSYGPSLLKRVRPDLGLKYLSENPDDIFSYFYHINAQKPTGEAAFKNMTISFVWPKRPMSQRFCEIDPEVPVSFIYGGRSWIKPQPAYHIKQNRENVRIEVIPDASHHVYADDPEAFNEALLSILHDSNHHHQQQQQQAN